MPDRQPEPQHHLAGLGLVPQVLLKILHDFAIGIACRALGVYIFVF